MTTELYKLYSHFNFSPEQWREAAQRYLALEDAMQRLETEDAEVDHDALGENFERCELCEQISELQDDRQEFATEFGAIWAKQLLAVGEETHG